MGAYRIFDEGEHKQMGDGGMMTKPPQVPVSCWSFYFNVDSIDKAIERVKAGGGKIMSGPSEVPGGSWIHHRPGPAGCDVRSWSAARNKAAHHFSKTSSTGTIFTSSGLRLSGRLSMSLSSSSTSCGLVVT